MSFHLLLLAIQYIATNVTAFFHYLTLKQPEEFKKSTRELLLGLQQQYFVQIVMQNVNVLCTVIIEMRNILTFTIRSCGMHNAKWHLVYIYPQLLLVLIQAKSRNKRNLQVVAVTLNYVFYYKLPLYLRANIQCKCNCACSV